MPTQTDTHGHLSPSAAPAHPPRHQEGTAAAPGPGVARLHHALGSLERSIQEVRASAEAAAQERGLPLPSLDVLNAVERVIHSVRAAAPSQVEAGTDPHRKTTLALDALWAARKELRRLPAVAVERLASVDLSDVDPRVVQAVYGAWLKHCRRLGLKSLFVYEAGFGSGAVVAPVEGGGLEVVTSIGLPVWPPGTRLSWRDVPGAKPLEEPRGASARPGD